MIHSFIVLRSFGGGWTLKEVQETRTDWQVVARRGRGRGRGVVVGVASGLPGQLTMASSLVERSRRRGRGSRPPHFEIVHTASTSRRGGSVIVVEEEVHHFDIREREEDEEEDYYARLARLNPIDNRTGRRTRRRSGPGSPTPESRRPVDWEVLRSTPNNYNGIPDYPPIVAYPANTDGSLDPEIVQLMTARNSAGFATRIQREVMTMIQKRQGIPLSYISCYLREQTCNGNKDRFFKGSLSVTYQIEAVRPAEATVLESITCSVCFDVAVGPMFQCKNEHVVCRNCRENLWREAGRSGNGGVCPTCRAPGVPFIRARIKEGWADHMLVHCGFHHLGCTTEGLIPEIKKHKKEECRFRTWVCYFCDIRISLNNAEHHISTHHSNSFQGNWTFNSIAKSFKAIQVPLEVDKYGLAFIKITVAGEGVFILAQIEVELRKYMYFIFKVDSKVNSQPYKMTGVIKYFIPEYPTLMRRQKWTASIIDGQCRLSKIFEHLDDAFIEGGENMCILDLGKYEDSLPKINFFVKLDKTSPEDRRLTDREKNVRIY